MRPSNFFAHSDVAVDELSGRGIRPRCGNADGQDEVVQRKQTVVGLSVLGIIAGYEKVP